MNFMSRNRKGPGVKQATPRKRKALARSLHGQAIEVSVDERLEHLIRRFPALTSSLGSLLLQGKKRIRDFPVPEQEKILRMVFALKKASRG